MIYTWNLGLLSLGLLLMLPKEKETKGYALLVNGMIILTIFSLTIGRSVVPPIIPFCFTLGLCAVRLRKEVLHAASFMGWFQALVFAVFAYRCEKFYPFHHWIGIPSGFLIAAVVGILIYIVRINQILPTTLWSAIFPIWMLIELFTSAMTDLLHLVEWFWQVELVLCLTKYTWEFVKIYTRRFRRQAV